MYYPLVCNYTLKKTSLFRVEGLGFRVEGGAYHGTIQCTFDRASMLFNILGGGGVV